MAKGFVYHGRNRTADDVAKKAKEGSRDYDGVLKPGLPTFQPKEGENQVRILPSPDAESPDWDLTIYSHYSIGPDNARYLCLEHAPDGNGKCPVCEARAETEDEDEKDALRTSKGTLCWVIDRDDEKAGPQIWTMPFTKVRNEIYARCVDKRTREAILVDDPEEGYDITFFRKGTGERTQYTGVEVSRDSSPLSENEKTQARWLDYVTEHPLADCLNWFSYDHIKKALYGKSTKKAEDADEEDEAESPRSRRARLAKEEDEEDQKSSRFSRRSRPEPVDEDEEDEKPARSSRRSKVDEDDEEEESPRSRRTSSPKEDLDDDIPFDKKERSNKRRALLDEEDEDEAPVSKGKKKPADDAEDEDEEDDTPSSTARRTLGNLRPRNKR